jgi:hypothetical protein
MRSSDVCVIAPLHAARCTISHTESDCVTGESLLERGERRGAENVCVGSSLTRLTLFSRPCPAACAHKHMHMLMFMLMLLLMLMLMLMLLLILFCSYLYRTYAQPSIANTPPPIPIQCQICVVYQVKVPADPSLTPLESDLTLAPCKLPVGARRANCSSRSCQFSFPSRPPAPSAIPSVPKPASPRLVSPPARLRV